MPTTVRLQIKTTVDISEEKLDLLYEEALEKGQNDIGKMHTVVEHLKDTIQTFASYVHERRAELE